MTVHPGERPPDFPRDEFVRSFGQHATTPPDSERVALRPAGASIMVVVVLLAAGLSGALWQIFHPDQPVRPEAAPSASAGTGFAAVAGWGCDGGPDRGFEATGRTPAWSTVETGGWQADGCRGTFQAMPFSGKADEDTRGVGALFWFTPGAAVSRCTVGVWVPSAPRRSDASATRARFLVSAGGGGTAYASFTVDQTGTPGWASAGTFPVSGDRFTVRQVDRGVPGSGTDRLAVTQVRVDCIP